MAVKRKKAVALIARQMVDADEAEITSWYEARASAPPPQYARDIGIVIEAPDGRALACGWLLRTLTGIAFGEYSQTNHTASTMEQARALRSLASHLVKLSKELGFQVLVGIVPDDKRGLGRYYMSLGAATENRKFSIFYKGV